MIRTGRIRTLLATLLLGSALSLPALQLAQTALPAVAHAALSPQSGPVLAGTWVPDGPKGGQFTTPFSALQITARFIRDASGLPTSIVYTVRAYGSDQQEVAAGTAVAPYAAGDHIRVPLTTVPLLPPSFRAVQTSMVVALLSNGIVQLVLTEPSPLTGHQFVVEYMQRA
jgi:hypothetical protein